MKNTKRFRVHVAGKFEAFYDTIEKARECRKALLQLKYEDIVISIDDTDVNPYKK